MLAGANSPRRDKAPSGIPGAGLTGQGIRFRPNRIPRTTSRTTPRSTVPTIHSACMRATMRELRGALRRLPVHPPVQPPVQTQAVTALPTRHVIPRASGQVAHPAHPARRPRRPRRPARRACGCRTPRRAGRPPLHSYPGSRPNGHATRCVGHPGSRVPTRSCRYVPRPSGPPYPRHQPGFHQPKYPPSHLGWRDCRFRGRRPRPFPRDRRGGPGTPPA